MLLYFMIAVNFESNDSSVIFVDLDLIMLICPGRKGYV